MSSDSNSKKLKFFLLSNKRKDADGSVVGKLKEKLNLWDMFVSVAMKVLT